MKRLFVVTSNYKRFRAGIAALETRGATEAGMMLVTSEPGYGKSITLEHWAAQNDAVILRAKVEWTPHYCMLDLAESLGVDQRGRAKDLFKRICENIGARPLVIDEVNHCLGRGAQVLEAIRDVTDTTEITCILGGHADVQPRVARYPQIRSRIAQVVEFQPATVEDVRLTCDQLVDVKVADDLVREIHRQSAGRMREVMNAIATVERVAQKNALKAMAARDIGDGRLVFDWQVRRPARAGAAPSTISAGVR